MLEMDYNTSGFALLADIIPEFTLEARYFSAFDFTIARIKDYLKPQAIITKLAAKSLKKITNKLLL